MKVNPNWINGKSTHKTLQDVTKSIKFSTTINLLSSNEKNPQKERNTREVTEKMKLTENYVMEFYWDFSLEASLFVLLVPKGTHFITIVTMREKEGSKVKTENGKLCRRRQNIHIGQVLSIINYLHNDWCNIHVHVSSKNTCYFKLQI